MVVNIYIYIILEVQLIVETAIKGVGNAKYLKGHKPRIWYLNKENAYISCYIVALDKECGDRTADNKEPWVR